MNVEINYLHIYAKKLNEVNETLLCLPKIADVVADPEDVKCFLKALEEIKATIETLPLAK